MRPSLMQAPDFTQDVSFSMWQHPPGQTISGAGLSPRLGGTGTGTGPTPSQSVQGSQRALAIRKLFALIKGKNGEYLSVANFGWYDLVETSALDHFFQDDEFVRVRMFDTYCGHLETRLIGEHEGKNTCNKLRFTTS